MKKPAGGSVEWESSCFLPSFGLGVRARKEVIIQDAAVRTWTAWGYRYAEIENLSERPMVVPNREGFFLYFRDPVIAEAGTKPALIALADATLLPPGGALKIQIMDS